MTWHLRRRDVSFDASGWWYSGVSMQAWQWSGRIIGAALWLTAIGLFLMPTAAALRSPAPAVARLAVLLLGLIGAVRPRLAIAALGLMTPIATYLAAQNGGPISGWSEALVVAACAGMLAHYAAASRLRLEWARRDRLVLAAIVLATIAALSAAILVSGERLAMPAGFAARLWAFLTMSYITERVAFRSIHQAAIVVEGMVLLGCAAVAFDTRERRHMAARMFILGAAAATALTLSRLVAAALRSGTPIETFLTALRSIRYYAALGDLNGAGSYLLLALFIAIAFAIWGIRDRAFLSAAFSTLIAALLTLGLWFTGSRTALGTAVVVTAAWCVAATWRRVPRYARGAILAAAAGVVIVAALAVTRFSQNQITVSGVLFMRYEMMLVSLRMLETAPLFGVGIGAFYERSAEFIRAPEVLLYYSRENAHNNLLQVLSETGVVGALAFLWVLVEAALRMVRGLRTDPSDMVQRGIVAGVAAFLLTTLTGHPLLVPELAYPFWIALGLGCAATGLAHAPAGALSRSAWFIAIALLVATIPVRLAERAANANLEHVSYGTTGWRMSPDGVRYKEFRRRAVFFIPTGASVVSMVVRSPEGDVRLQVAWNGRPADVLPITGTDWRELRLRVPPSDHQRRYEPMELQIVDPPERRDALVHAGRIVVRTLRAQ